MKFYRWSNTPLGTFITMLAFYALLIWPGQVLLHRPMKATDMWTVAVMGLCTATLLALLVGLRDRHRATREKR